MMPNSNPYTGLDSRAFWRSAVTERPSLDTKTLYTPKFQIPDDVRIMTAGSCFAFHIGRALRHAGLIVLDGEPLPSEIPDQVANTLGYRQYSARYGNIYTVAQLWQLIQEAEGLFEPAEPIWVLNDRFFDAQRPNIEPGGYESPDVLLESRKHHLAAVSQLIRKATLFVFTFGLTEAWIHLKTGTVYPTAPGVLAGEFDPNVYQFKNYDALSVFEDFVKFRSFIKSINPKIRFIVTVSPVPMTATASGQHIEVANTYSKSILRAVAGKLHQEFEDIDYFPSYEIITSTANRGVYYKSNLRTVSSAGVDAAMKCFLNAHSFDPLAKKATMESSSYEDDSCDEVLLEAFAP